MIKEMGKLMNESRILRNASLALAALFLGAGLMACSLNQDPYADKSEAIKQGVPPEVDRPAPVPKPVASDALRIDSLDFYTFKEQVEGEITISGRVLAANPTFELSIDNLKDFPGAKFDSKLGSFKWLPPRDTTGGEYGAPKRLVVRLTAPSMTGGATLGTTKAILLYVTRGELDPEIVSVEDLVKPNPTREGEVRKFNVVVKDPDSSDVDGGRPRINAIPAKRGASDISGLVYMEESTTTDPNPVQDASNKQLWTFKMLLDLRVPVDQRGRDFTRTQAKFIFGLQATSRFGRVGVKEVEASILTDVLKPEVSFFDPIDVVAGQENVIQFTAFDPYAEGKVTVNFVTRVDQLPGSAIQNCKAASREGNQLCRISWKPTATTKGDFVIELKVLNESKVPGDRKVNEATYRLTLHVIPGQDPAPVPLPGPATP
ncbi:hypothetical protein BH10BDE1_BH10BDE1_29200 [soil metagenome]